MHPVLTHPIQAIYMAFPGPFVYLQTQMHPLFEIHELIWLVNGQNVTVNDLNTIEHVQEI